LTSVSTPRPRTNERISTCSFEQWIETLARSQIVERRSISITPSTTRGAESEMVSSTPPTVSKAASGRRVRGPRVAFRPSADTSSRYASVSMTTGSLT
jgi:hypothetical protein